MTVFKSYQKIPETISGWALETAEMRRLQRAAWCVTEKIHGANFCWVVTEAAVACAKRKAVLAPDDEFFNYQLVKEALSPTVRQVFEQVVAAHATDRVYIYGELFGGAYPHPEVPADPRAGPVQTGVYYAPTLAFCAFDIAVDTAEGVTFLNYEAAIGYFENAGLFYARPLFVGKMQEALNYPIRFTSTIPALLHLPPLDVPNIAEGVVLKPVEPLLINTPKGRIRPILKKKIAEFAEDARFHQAEKWKDETKHTHGGDYLLDEVEWDITMLVTSNRLSNAISKVGRLTPQNRDDIALLLKEDVEDELANKYGDRLLTLTAEERALLESVLVDHINVLLKR